MEAIFVESIMSVVAVSVLGILGLQTLTGLLLRRASNSRSLRKKIRDRATLESARSRGLRPGRSSSQRIQPISRTEALAQPIVALTFQVCPSCRLEAPSKLMEEHFLGSPIHRNGRSQGPVEEDETFGKIPVKQDPAITGLLRTLMRFLVPPRAFGLRGQERTVDPLRGVVQRPALFERIPSNFGLVP